MRSLFLLLAVLALSACAAGSTAQQTPPWRLVAATDAAGERHVVVTITRADQAAQDALAEALEADHSLSLIAEWPLVSIDVHCLVFRLEPGADGAAVLTALRSDPRIRTAQPMQRFATAAIAADRDLSELQDAHALLMLDRAHTVSTGEGVRIGVIDTLADTSHPDLSESVRLVRDFVGEQATPTAETHGTAIAGIIGAEAASGRGIVGVAPDAEILSLRACWETTRGMPGECSTFSLARALNFAILQEIDVINMSIGGPYDPLLDELLVAASEKDIVMVAAEGEGGTTPFPASSPRVLGAAPWGDSAPDQGGEDRVFAPGRDILSTAPAAGYDFFSGSSIASAFVAGTAALLLDVEPEAGKTRVNRALLASSDSAEPGALLNACAAINAVAPGTPCAVDTAAKRLK